MTLKPRVNVALELNELRRWDGSTLRPHTAAEIRRELERMALLDLQIKKLRKEQDERLKLAPQQQPTPKPPTT